MTKALTFSGIVQGIGFRPTALRIANTLGVKGQVKNSGGNVELIITGDNKALDEFVQRLAVLFDIKSYKSKEISDINFIDFKIVHSDFDKNTPFLTPDLATCKDCEKELKDEHNRRYRHPFISCINCGPRYTIMNTLPYDRENITMSPFEMCDECKKEYTTADDRRCHAQTIACNECGPELSMTIDDAVKQLNNGEVIAIKDIGGYHLACKTGTPAAVKKIRELKGREAKPFAVMFNSIHDIQEYCKINNKEKELLLSPARPIVLLEKIKDFDYSICGDSDYIGAFLPCNPVQIMLLEKASPLVMTSANISGEPIIIDDNEIMKFGVPVLSHNREILTPLDDSVLAVNNGKTQFIRRARGYVPLAIDIGKKAECDTLLMGGDLKAVFGFHRDNYVFLSQYFGDLEDSAVFDCYKENIKRFAALHSFSMDKVVCDKHPAYYSSNIYNADLKVQHHIAHIASVLAEHKLEGEVLGFAFDGTGYGDDGAIWGSEVFLFDGRSFNRKAHLDYTKMLGSDEISKNADLDLDCYLGGNPIIDKAIENNINTVNSSSMGRLFDAVASLLDIRHYNSYEGECAIALENCARKAVSTFKLTPSLNPKEILEQIQKAKNKASAESIALGLHFMLSELILNIANEYKITQIALSGGVFNNRLLMENTALLLEQNGYKVYTNELVPCGDGCIALGQAYMASLEE